MKATTRDKVRRPMVAPAGAHPRFVLYAEDWQGGVITLARERTLAGIVHAHRLAEISSDWCSLCIFDKDEGCDVNRCIACQRFSTTCMHAPSDELAERYGDEPRCRQCWDRLAGLP